jgi:hypothetical protein
MRRRESITLIGGAAALASPRVRQHTATRLAQQEDPVMTATVSSPTKVDACAWSDHCPSRGWQ